VAGAASGLGEGRARDVCFAARQEYASARGVGEGATATCSQRLPLLSDRVDGQLRERDRPELEEHLSGCVSCGEVLRVYQDFSTALKELALPSATGDPLVEALGAPTARPDRQPTGARRFLGAINSTAALFLLLLGGVIVFRFCGSTPIETGVGRTSDIVYARASDGGAIVALESGTGRKLVQLPSGMLAGNGSLVVGSSHDCGVEGCRTIVVRTHTATGGEAGVGALQGKLELVGVDARGGTAFFADVESAWSRIVIFDLEQGRARGEVDGPPGVQEAFNPEGRALAATSTILFTLGRSAVDGSLVVVETDLERMGVIGRLPIEGPRELRVGLFPSPRVGQVFVYFPSGPVLQEIEPAAGRVVQTLDLGQGAGAADPFYVPTRGSLVAADPQGHLYVVLPTGGIAVLNPEPLEVVRQIAIDHRYRSVGASTDGRVVYAVGFDGSYRVLDAVDGRQLVSRPTAEVDDILQVNAGE
jgi:outer membrane protein assembly factor BamB